MAPWTASDDPAVSAGSCHSVALCRPSTQPTAYRLHLPAMTDRSPLAVAILDVDGTLVSGSLGVRLLTLLAERSQTRQSALQTIRRLAALRNEGKLSQRAFALRATDLFGAGIEGLEFDTLDNLSRKVLADPRQTIHPFSKDLISLFRSRAITPMLISSSPDFIVRQLADYLGVRFAAGTSYFRSANSYTRRPTVIPSIDGGKVRLARQLVAPARIAWRASIAIGNGIADQPVLARVGTPVVFEPDPDLEQVAHKKGWPITDRTTIIEQVTITPRIGMA
jgi:phosphoserine phosphatase